MTYDVILLPQAERDVDEILAWLYERSSQGAATWYRRWLEAIAFLGPGAFTLGVLR